MADGIVLPPTKLARVAGLLYLALDVCGLFGVFARGTVVVTGDPAATADNIRASATLFRLGFVIDLLGGVPFLLLALVLYLLLKHVNQVVAAAMVIFVVVSVAVGSVILLNEYTALTIATGDTYTRAFGEAGADALTLVFAELHHNGYALNALFFGPWLVPLGYLVIKSGYFPKVLGVLLFIGCFSYLALLLTTFLAPEAPGILRALVFGGVGELVFTVWLLVKGVRVPASAAPVGPAEAPQPLP
jgi:Domain of unknown function (DUF4386)